MRTRNLVAKAYCYRRQVAWDMQDNREPIVSKTTITALQAALLAQPPAEVMKAAQELGITLAEVGFHVC
jgi:hypothetical protein